MIRKRWPENSNFSMKAMQFLFCCTRMSKFAKAFRFWRPLVVASSYFRTCFVLTHHLLHSYWIKCKRAEECKTTGSTWSVRERRCNGVVAQAWLLRCLRNNYWSFAYGFRIIAHVEYDIDSHVYYDLLGYEYCSMSAFACRALFFFACQPTSQSNQLTVNPRGFYIYGGDSSR